MTRTNTTPYRKEQRLFFSALSLFILLFSLYIYFISAAVVHVVARKEIDRELAQVNSHIGDMESTFISVKQAITPETIGQYGFTNAAQKKVYVAKAPANLVLVTHDEN